ncbi:hypothetical protein D3C79_827690 [compost metagenome]
MNHLHLWRPDCQQAGRGCFQAQVDITMGMGERGFVEPLQSTEDFATDHQAARRDRWAVLLDRQPIQVTHGICGLTGKSWRNCAFGVQQQARLGKLAVSIEQLGTDHAYFRTLRLVEQRFDPVGIDHFGVRRQQYQVLPLGLGTGSVAQRCRAQALGTLQHAHLANLLLRQPFEQLR